MSNIVDLVGLQNDVAAGLANRDELQNVTVVQYRQFLIQSESDLHAALFNPRNGRAGTAICVEMPKATVKHPNLQGPEFYLSLPVVSLCIPEMAANPTTGSLVQAEDCWQLVADTLHGFRPRASLGYVIGAEENLTLPARDVGNGAMELNRGILAYRTTHTLRVTRTQTPRCDAPTATLGGGSVTLTNGPNTPNARIFFTTDGSYPAQFPTPGVVSTPYNGPFSVDSGTIVRWAAYYPEGGFQASFGGWLAVP